MSVTRKGTTILPAAMGILGSIMVIGFASSTRSASTNRYLDAARARRMLSVVSRSVTSEACYILEETVGPTVGKGRMKERSATLNQGGAPRTVEVPLSVAQFAGQRVTISPVTAVFSPLKRMWDKNRNKGKDGKLEGVQDGEEFPKGSGVPENGEGKDEPQPPTDEETEKEDGAYKPKDGEPKDPEDDESDQQEGSEGRQYQQVAPEGGLGAEATGETGGGGPEAGGQGGGEGKEGGKGGKGKWRRRGYWGLVQLKFDVIVETQGHPLKRRIAVRRFVMVRKWPWHPMRIDVLDVARSQEAVQ